MKKADLSTKEVAAVVGLSTRTLKRMRDAGKGPPWRKVGWFVRYPTDGVERWKSEFRK